MFRPNIRLVYMFYHTENFDIVKCVCSFVAVAYNAPGLRTSLSWIAPCAYATISLSFTYTLCDNMFTPSAPRSSSYSSF